MKKVFFGTDVYLIVGEKGAKVRKTALKNVVDKKI